MALTITYQQEGQTMAMWTSPQRLYITRDGSKVVPEDSPEAAFLLVAAGSEIPLAEAQRLGLVDAEGKAVQPAQDKALKGPKATKGR